LGGKNADIQQVRNGPPGAGALAERVGFEPTIPFFDRIPLFESGAFNLSATSPHPPIVFINLF
jgi:hypothetical protein